MQDEWKRSDPLPQCVNICVTTDESKVPNLQVDGTNDPSRAVAFQVVTVVDPEVIKKNLPRSTAGIHSLRLRQRKYPDNFRKNLVFYSPNIFHEPPKARWKKKKSKTFTITPQFPDKADFLPTNKTATDEQTCADVNLQNDVNIVVTPRRFESPKLDDQPIPSLKERIRQVTRTLKLLKSKIKKTMPTEMEKAIEPETHSLGDKLVMNQKGEEETEGPKENRVQIRLVKKKKKKQKKKMEPKKKVNLRKFKQEIPITGTDYSMELYLGPEIIDKTRMGKFDITKEPHIRVNYNKSADLRDEFSSYCGMRKKLKNWLYYTWS